ncbi:hypothetical protein [Salinimicrobium soli]|uniref:hypothetical protein n=1 Tax=Salinimicrobium soli TaxID=1254399 RepID=UPI003AAAD260
MDRKTFLKKASVGLLIGIPTVSLLGCSGSDDNGNPNPNPNPDPDPSANCLQNGTNSSVSTTSGHTHSLSVPKEDVSAGVEKTYMLSQAAAHIHEVTITAAMFQSLQSNNSVNATSTSQSGHTHSVTVSCA